VAYRPGKKDVLGDWTTGDLTLTVVRPLEAAEVPPPGGRVELGAGVSLSGHSAFKGKVSLGSVGDAGRALGTLEVPAIFRDDSALSQPLLFQTARGSDPGLGVLQFTDLREADSVTSENPLRVRISTDLSPGEHVIPFAWDGEFYLPLGAARAIEDGIEIEIRQMPRPLSTIEDVKRGILSSVRILFQKLASSYLGTKFDYPHLAAVSYDLHDQPCYEKSLDAVKANVATANKILLYVHGILGDTQGMTAAARVQSGSPAIAERISDLYDLVLAFDYENINTSIKENARALKQRLASIGLGPDHGKTLHVVAHSMGGLVMRWLIEQEDGARIVQHLTTLGTPHAGSPWPTIENWATAALAIGLNGLSQVAWPLKLIGDLAGAIETVDVSLDEMALNSQFLSELEKSGDPRVPYTLLIGNTSILPEAAASGTLQALLARLAPQRVLHDVAALAFLKRPNDIAVAVTSAGAVPRSRVPQPTMSEVACDHVTFFTSDAGRQALLNLLKQL
jgi:pimeloyl-ACP methyl ester carboxylesterase